MSLSRRDFFKVAGLAISGALVSTGTVGASSGEADPNEYIGMLYDATMCVGCNACTNACREWNKTKDETDARGLYDAPKDTSAKTWTLIKLYQGENESSFVKRQCMHCVDPACASGCPVHALQKTEAGAVAYTPSNCIGCRYCMYSCPFSIPRFEWDKAFDPSILKCTLCADRLADGKGTACAESCPAGALIWGKRGELIAIAEKRIQENPDKYVNHIYGKDDIGGTGVMYLAGVYFDKLGLPDFGTQPITQTSESIGNVLLPSLIVGVPILLGALRMTSKTTDGKE